MLTASTLRADIYNILDHIIKTGQPAEVHRNGAVIRLSLARKPPAAKSKSKLENLRQAAVAEVWVGDPNDIFHPNWKK